MTGPLTVARPPAGGARRPRLPAAPVDILTGPTHAPSVAPDGSAVAFIVDESGYPRAVQQFLDGTSVRDGRYVTLPVEGPITKVVHSPDGRWLAIAADEYTGSSIVLIRTISCFGPALSRIVSPSSLVIAIMPLNATAEPMKCVGLGGRPP